MGPHHDQPATGTRHGERGSGVDLLLFETMAVSRRTRPLTIAAMLAKWAVLPGADARTVLVVALATQVTPTVECVTGCASTASGASPWPSAASGLTLPNRDRSGDPAKRASAGTNASLRPKPLSLRARACDLEAAVQTRALAQRMCSRSRRFIIERRKRLG